MSVSAPMSSVAASPRKRKRLSFTPDTASSSPTPRVQYLPISGKASSSTSVRWWRPSAFDSHPSRTFSMSVIIEPQSTRLARRQAWYYNSALGTFRVPHRYSTHTAFRVGHYAVVGMGTGDGHGAALPLRSPRYRRMRFAPNDPLLVHIRQHALENSYVTRQLVTRPASSIMQACC